MGEHQHATFAQALLCDVCAAEAADLEAANMALDDLTADMGERPDLDALERNYGWMPQPLVDLIAHARNQEAQVAALTAERDDLQIRLGNTERIWLEAKALRNRLEAENQRLRDALTEAKFHVEANQGHKIVTSDAALTRWHAALSEGENDAAQDA